MLTIFLTFSCCPLLRGDSCKFSLPNFSLPLCFQHTLTWMCNYCINTVIKFYLFSCSLFQSAPPELTADANYITVHNEKQWHWVNLFILKWLLRNVQCVKQTQFNVLSIYLQTYIHIGLFRWFCVFQIMKLKDSSVSKLRMRPLNWKIFNLNFMTLSFSVFSFLEMHLDTRHLVLPSFNLMVSEKKIEVIFHISGHFQYGICLLE